MTGRDLARLTGVHPALVDALREVFEEAELWGHPMFVVAGVRTQQQQQELYAIGRRGRPGERVVTFKDGVIHKSNHQPHEDGKGYAVDCAFIDGNPFAETHPWEKYGRAVEARGLIWGGRWGMRDLPHAELSDVGVGRKTA